MKTIEASQLGKRTILQKRGEPPGFRTFTQPSPNLRIPPDAQIQDIGKSAVITKPKTRWENFSALYM